MVENTYRAFEALESCRQPFGNYATAIEKFERLAACYPDVTLQRFSTGDTPSPWCRSTRSRTTSIFQQIEHQN